MRTGRRPTLINLITTSISTLFGRIVLFPLKAGMPSHYSQNTNGKPVYFHELFRTLIFNRLHK